MLAKLIFTKYVSSISYSPSIHVTTTLMPAVCSSNIVACSMFYCSSNIAAYIMFWQLNWVFWNLFQKHRCLHWQHCCLRHAIATLLLTLYSYNIVVYNMFKQHYFVIYKMFWLRCWLQYVLATLLFAARSCTYVVMHRISKCSCRTKT